jgi:hypothetical protein
MVRVRSVGEDDFIVAIEDVRDGRTQLIHSSVDLRHWLQSFVDGICIIPAAAICGRCDRLHIDRDVDGELLKDCIPCSGELVALGAEMFLADGAHGER